ncbi:MAG TPA: 30S ribosomal protein S12 methylthiotransferase RimO [Salinivirga sp.]|uniref:30S ribosomal protein S12 methylthiotransferase RimO n=1 Tax=Salinivirga sp. TaxID=1970192 RepID=UPI002B4A8F9E|nr:30S ribosomal protein S12 methylthiotransferase RimO [Salinivirga sp.]HKK60099.1 30S ribosomal protein S12 methylthiotransferase RimO [Salinivirga sp.]
MKKVNIINLGCAKNLVDSEHLARQLQANGYRVVYDHPELHDYTLINTCGFIHDAQQESIDTILEAVTLKNKHPESFVGVFGCLTQIFKEQLKKEIPEVDGWFGKYDFKAILSALQGKHYKDYDHERVISTPSHFSYLKISEGCHRKCAFCSIPVITGNYKSVPAKKLVKEAEFLAKTGVKELILIAQDLTYYGQDLEQGPTLTGLVQMLSKIEGIEWIRFHYAYPVGIPEDLFDEMQANPKVCRYLDIPVQHISDNVLKAMKRGHNSQKTAQLIQNIKNKVTGIALRTTMMVGFPGETTQDFEQLLEFVRTAKFDRLGAFPYSHEKYTYAYDHLKDDVSEEIKEQRLEQLMEVQHEIALERNTAMVGQTLRVIIDRKEDTVGYGRSEFDSPEVDGEIIIENGELLKVGAFYDIKITGAEAYELFGKVTNYA